jgi:NADP-dependent 3-hydroxy acid dehydrogenase YdfG
VIGVVYFPPSTDENHLINYLTNSLSRIECCIPNAGVILAGDFNRADVSQLLSQFRLSQMVKFTTRGERALDLI